MLVRHRNQCLHVINAAAHIKMTSIHTTYAYFTFPTDKPNSTTTSLPPVITILCPFKFTPKLTSSTVKKVLDFAQWPEQNRDNSFALITHQQKAAVRNWRLRWCWWWSRGMMMMMNNKGEQKKTIIRLLVRVECSNYGNECPIFSTSMQPQMRHTTGKVRFD